MAAASADRPGDRHYFHSRDQTSPCLQGAGDSHSGVGAQFSAVETDWLGVETASPIGLSLGCAALGSDPGRCRLASFSFGCPRSVAVAESSAVAPG